MHRVTSYQLALARIADLRHQARRDTLAAPRADATWRAAATGRRQAHECLRRATFSDLAAGRTSGEPRTPRCSAPDGKG